MMMGPKTIGNFAPALRVDDSKQILRTGFLSDLNRSNAPVHKKLASLIETKKWRLKTLFHKVQFDNEQLQVTQLDNDKGSDVYLVMVKSVSDIDLKKLGEEHGFPRGFPIVWHQSDSSVVSFGFYPKFDNDKALPSIKAENFQKATKITFFRKWSGFLSMVIPIKLPNNKGIFWTVTSKNSCHFSDLNVTTTNANIPSETAYLSNDRSGISFVQDAYEIWAKQMSPELLQAMADNNTCLCAETMSERDQCHGARVFRNCAIVTAVGKGAGSWMKDRETFVEYEGNISFLISGVQTILKMWTSI